MLLTSQLAMVSAYQEIQSIAHSPAALIDTCRQLSAETWEALLSCTTRYRIDRFSVETADEEGNKGHHGQPHQPYLFKKVRQINLAFWEKQFYGSGWDEYSGNWEAFVDFVAGNFNVSNLIIIIDTDPNRRTGMNCEHEVKELPYPYSRLMGPLRRLTGLKRLHFEWPTEYAEEPEALERRLQDIKNGLRHLD